MKNIIQKVLVALIINMGYFMQGNAAGPGPNCVVSPITGNTEITGAGVVTQLYYVTSNGQHIWTLPAGASIFRYGSSGNDSAYISFSPSFTEGTISVRRNGNSCVSYSQSITVKRSTCKMSVDLGNDQKVYYGYQPMACANITANISMGTPPYTYSWSNGESGSSINVCPDIATTYSVTVTDSRGCTSTDEVRICVTNVICYAGNSGNAKVEICHKNGKTICVSENAVPAQLAIGGRLGSCAEANEECGSNTSSSDMASSETPEYKEISMKLNGNTMDLLTIHNPSDDEIYYNICSFSGKSVMGGILNRGFNDINITDLPEGLYVIRTDNYKVIKFLK